MSFSVASIYAIDIHNDGTAMNDDIQRPGYFTNVSYLESAEGTPRALQRHLNTAISSEFANEGIDKQHLFNEQFALPQT